MLAPAIVKRAEKEGLRLVENGPLVEAHEGKRVMAFHSDPNKAIAKALERREEDRLRSVDKRPQDREPVLKVRPKSNVLPLPAQTAPPPTAEQQIQDKIDNVIRQTAKSAAPIKVHPTNLFTPNLTFIKKDDGKSNKEVIKGSIIKAKYRDRYKKTGYSCGDDIAYELRAYTVILVDGRSRVSLGRLREVAVTNHIWRDSYAALNPGQQRMTIGNRLRAKLAEGERIDIGGAIHQLEFKDL